MKKEFPTKTWHIIFDTLGCNKKILDNEKFIIKLLLEIPKIIKMKILSGPHLVRSYNRINPGLSGFVIVDFSYILIYTFFKTKEIFIDVFSCKKFDYQKVKKYLYNKLKVKPEQVETLEIKYPWEK